MNNETFRYELGASILGSVAFVVATAVLLVKLITAEDMQDKEFLIVITGVCFVTFALLTFNAVRLVRLDKKRKDMLKYSCRHYDYRD